MADPFGSIVVVRETFAGPTGAQGPTGATGPAGPQGATGPGVSSSEVVVESGLLGPSGVWLGTVGLGRSFVLSRLTTDRPARVRVYADDVSAAADLYRDVGVVPSGSHGLILEVVSTWECLSWSITPGVIGCSVDGVVSVVVTNFDDSSGTVVVTVRRLLLEV